MDSVIPRVVPNPLEWFFHFAKEIIIQLLSRLVMVDVPESPIGTTQKVMDGSSGIASSIVIQTDEGRSTKCRTHST